MSWGEAAGVPESRQDTATGTLVSLDFQWPKVTEQIAPSRMSAGKLQAPACAWKAPSTLNAFAEGRSPIQHQAQDLVCEPLPVCSGTEMCILQFILTTAWPPASKAVTTGPSAGSFSIRSLTS